ncbi:MAG: hypothetical protein J1E82_06790 [Muribaculaceae bacterium]|nr:hypothetical protein [Muribaculaceae bacterium]
MKNPYIVLGISQNATNQEIIVSVAKAMKNRTFSTREIAEARVTLSKPASRLAADFTFPIFPQRKKIRLIVPTLKSTGITIDSIDPDKYDSL